MIDCAAKTLRWEGLSGLYKGVASPLVGQMLFRAVLFGAYSQATAWLAQGNAPNTRLSTAQYFLAGGLTGMFAAVVEGPVDLFKSQVRRKTKA